MAGRVKTAVGGTTNFFRELGDSGNWGITKDPIEIYQVVIS